MSTVNDRIERTNAVVAALKRLTQDALRFEGASKDGIHVSVDCNQCESGRSTTTAVVRDEDETYGGHVSRDVGHWWSSLTPTQRAWVKDNGRLFHCRGRISGVEIVVDVD